jgi:hypothetical protein
MILILRGHIRNAFDNDELFNLINIIYRLTAHLEIYIHTWSIKQNNISWRHIETDNAPITKETITNYFRTLSRLIKHIIIDDDTQIKITGNTVGVINKGHMPVIGWKNYWYGQKRIIDYLDGLFEDKNSILINMRFDILNVHGLPLQAEKIVDFIETHKNMVFYKNVFIYGKGQAGVDNIYNGSLDCQKRLIYHFHNNMDSIIKTNEKIIKQELFVYEENEKLFPEPFLHKRYLKMLESKRLSFSNKN